MTGGSPRNDRQLPTKCRPNGVANGAAAHAQHEMVIADSASETSSASADSVGVAPPPRPAKRLQHEVDSQANGDDGGERAVQARPAQKKRRQMQEAEGPSSERSTERNTGPFQPVHIEMWKNRFFWLAWKMLRPYLQWFPVPAMVPRSHLETAEAMLGM